ncbi:MAG: M6 family metalloprotease domain-containing protein [Dysgonamonadaceae bacterium]|nr:M6 family metalloprotease domain-containing protein [Dysgonamonadaceae bacterium]
MKNLFRLTIFLLLMNFTTALRAVPAYPNPVKIKQPDGSEITLVMHGDENLHWMESTDGYTLMYNSERYVVFAEIDGQGSMAPSSIIASDKQLRSAAVQEQLQNIPKHIRYSEAQINTLKQIRQMTRSLLSNADSGSLRAAVGTKKAVCALFQFPDKPFVKTREEFEQLMNQSGYSTNGAQGSVKDYYLEVSYGQLDMEVTLAGPFTATKNSSYYGANDSEGYDIYSRLAEFAAEAADSTFKSPDINPADFDNDGDGYIDAFHIIFSGEGEEAGGGADAIWSHSSTIGTRRYSGKRLNSYSCSPELLGTGITSIGVICHELCHILGAPDFYDVDYETGGEYEGTGNWDLMAGGSWNNYGRQPAHVNMYQKIQFGWVSPEVLDTPKIITEMPNSAQFPAAYIVNTITPNEYFVLENRQKVGFDASVPGHGLLIYRISVTNQAILLNTVNNTHPQKVYPVCASSTAKIPVSVSTYGNINSAGCPFPGNSGKTSFTDSTTPAAVSWNSKKTGKPITAISENSGKISFQFMQAEPEPVANLQVTVQTDTVQLLWDKPSTVPRGYNVYRDNKLIIKLLGEDNTFYTQYKVAAGTYTYGVTAFYQDTESAQTLQTVTVEENTNTGIDEYYKKSAIISPNPVKRGETLSISIDNDGQEAQLLLFNSAGQLLWQTKTTACRASMKMDAVPGVYLLKIRQNQQSTTIKILVK